MVHRRTLLFLMAATWAVSFIHADTISYRDFPRGDKTIEGNVVAESSKGDILVETADGKLIDIEKIFIQEHKKSDSKVELDDREKLVTNPVTKYRTILLYLSSYGYEETRWSFVEFGCSGVASAAGGGGCARAWDV